MAKRFLLFLFSLFVFAPAAGDDPYVGNELRKVNKNILNDDNNLKRDQIRIGMSPENIRTMYGMPDKIARQVLFQRFIEQWLYKKKGLRVAFDCFKGRDAIVVSAQQVAVDES